MSCVGRLRMITGNEKVSSGLMADGVVTDRESDIGDGISHNQGVGGIFRIDASGVCSKVENPLNKKRL